MSVIKSFFKALATCIRYINTYFKTFVLLLIILIIFLFNTAKDPANLQKIHINGAIIDSSELVNELYKAMSDDSIKGVLLDINSPGGAAGASMEIALAIEELSKIKPVVAYAREYMTSGAYLAASSSTHIIANPISIIGSIGVLLSSVDISEALAKLGIKDQSLSAGKYKEVLSFSKPIKDEERAYMQRHLDDMYEVFSYFVAEKRGLDMKEIKTWADARIFIARKALKVGLIDELGSIKNAEEKLQSLSKIDKAIWKESKSNTLLQELSISLKLVNSFLKSLSF